MLEDSGTSVLLTQSFLLDQLPLAKLKHQIICLDRVTFSLALIDNPNPQSTPDNLAYVIYTSGSTGQPKGVTGQTHLNYSRSQRRLRSNEKIRISRLIIF